MFDDDDSGVAAVMMEVIIMTAGLTGINVHHEMMLLLMNMTVLKIAEMIVMIMVVSITVLTMKMTVMMVVSSPDIDARE